MSLCGPAAFSRPDREEIMKKKHAVAWVGLGLAFLCGCERHSNKETFYLVTANSGLPYWQTAAAGFSHAATQYKVKSKVVGPDGYDAQAELAALQQAVATKPGGILISVADAAVLQPGIDAAVQAGVPIITIDSDAATSHRLFFIGTNNLEAGRLSGKHVAEKLKNKGNIIVFTLTGQPNTTDRLLVAWDVNQDTLDGIKAGTIEATIAQKPYTMGYYGLKALDEVLHSPPQHLDKDFGADSFSPYPVFVDTGTSLVDKNNVDFYLTSAAAGSK